MLLIFEGALRKWVVPDLSGPLLLVRDPVAILIIWEAFRKHQWPGKWTTIIGGLAVMILGLGVVQVVLGITPWFVVVYGLRSYLLPFPVAFIMAENLNAEDLRKFGNCTLFLMLPLTLLEVVQYYSPSSSFWNAAVSQGAEQLAYGGGHVRASATFSYVSGPGSYLPLVAAFIFYGLANRAFAKRWLLLSASFALILAIPLTGSRAVAFTLFGVVGCVGIAGLFGVSQFVRSIQTILALAFLALLVFQLPVFSDAADTFTQRFESATKSEGGSVSQSFLARTVVPSYWAVEENMTAGNWLGAGIGYGAGAMSQLLTGRQAFTLGENEFERVLGEFGWPCGLAFLLVRLILAFTIMAKAIAKAREREPLAWLLVPLTWPALCMSVFEQPTEQGFMVIAVGFSLAALKLVPESPGVIDPRLLRLQKVGAMTRRQAIP